MATTIEREIEAEAKDPAPSLKIKNIGPIETLTLPVPSEGGVVILKGRNGAGKTKALEATQALISGSGSLSVRDRQLAGAVEGFGAKITVGRSTRRTGELECLSLEGKLDIAALVDPGMKDPAAADARRIKALIVLSGAKADKSAFVDIIGNEEDFEAIVSKSATETDDPVDMAAKVKRDIEKAARKAEDDSEKANGHAQGMLQSIDGVDLAQECAAEVLQGALEAAIEEHSGLKKQAEAFDRTALAQERARESLLKAQEAYQGPSYEEATDAYHNAETATTRAEEAVEDAAIKLRHLQAELERHKHALDQADTTRFAALQHKNAIEAWQAQIEEQSAIEDVPVSQIAEAADAVTKARERVEVGAKVREAKKLQVEAQTHAKRATSLAKYAARLREAAKACDEALSKAVASDLLRVEGGRLVLDTERGATLFSDLSHGQRWKIAIDLAAERVGVGGLIVVEQEAWESLDPANRQFVAEHAQRRKVAIITAEATEGELRAEVYEEGKE